MCFQWNIRFGRPWGFQTLRAWRYLLECHSNWCLKGWIHTRSFRDPRGWVRSLLCFAQSFWEAFNLCFITWGSSDAAVVGDIWQAGEDLVHLCPFSCLIFCCSAFECHVYLHSFVFDFCVVLKLCEHFSFSESFAHNSWYLFMKEAC